MSNRRAGPRAGTFFAPHRIALFVTWVLASAAVLVMLFHDARHAERFRALRYLLQSIYVATLLWHLGRTGPPIDRCTRVPPRASRHRKYAARMTALGVAMLFAWVLVSDRGVDVLLLLLIIATPWILLAWRREIRLRAVAQGVAVALIVLLAALPAVRGGLVGGITLFIAATSAPMYVAGGLLLERTRLGGLRLHAGRYGAVVTGVLWGALLFLPLGLANGADVPPGTDIGWLSEWWMPFTLPLVGIAEETWFRLLLVGLCFFLLRPAFRKRPALAVVAAVVFSGITFGLAHAPTPRRFLTTGVLHGVPMAALFARRDWEHAVGAHYMVNLIPFLVIFLES